MRPIQGIAEAYRSMHEDGTEPNVFIARHSGRELTITQVNGNIVHFTYLDNGATMSMTQEEFAEETGGIDKKQDS